MRGVLVEVPEFILQWRARTGADRWDEMWNGVLHMVPAPNDEHQDLAGDLRDWLKRHWARPGGHRVYLQVNLASVGNWPDDYRIPDLLLLARDRMDVNRRSHFEGPPTAVVEIRSPGDETSEKMAFYAALGVPEVWIIDRPTKQPEVYLLRDGSCQLLAAQRGWTISPLTGVRMKATRRRLVVQMGEEERTRAELAL